jgi:hypothetical protein
MHFFGRRNEISREVYATQVYPGSQYDVTYEYGYAGSQYWPGPDRAGFREGPVYVMEEGPRFGPAFGFGGFNQNRLERRIERMVRREDRQAHHHHHHRHW